MGFPIILVDSASGSDTAASGAGPATALSGTTNASTSATGLVVTLPNGTVLTGVATDGSHAIFLNDSTAGARNFGKITASSGSGGATPTVTVSDAFGLSLSGKSWAIGGKRATITGTTSKKLFDNNGGSGDAMPGWAVEMQSGHAESIGGQIDFRRAGDTTNGRITLRGKSGAATMPVLTWTGGTIGLVPRQSGWVFQDFDLRSTVGGSVIWTGASTNIKYIGLVAEHATNHWTDGFYLTGGGECIGCRVGRMTNDGIRLFSDGCSAIGCRVHHNGGVGIGQSAEVLSGLIYKNEVYANTSHGLSFSGVSTSPNRRLAILANTVHGNGGDGIRIDSAGQTAFNTVVADNNLTNNGGYGLNYPNASSTAAAMSMNDPQIRNNNTYNNSINPYNPSGVGLSDPGVDPGYADATNGDFTPSNTLTQAALGVVA